MQAYKGLPCSMHRGDLQNCRELTTSGGAGIQLQACERYSALHLLTGLANP